MKLKNSGFSVKLMTASVFLESVFASQPMVLLLLK